MKTDTSISRFFGTDTQSSENSQSTAISTTRLAIAFVEVSDPTAPAKHCEIAMVPPCEPATSNAIGQPQFVNDDLKVRAEIRWVLKSVATKVSIRHVT